MCRNWCEYRYDAIELSKFHVCFWILLSHRDKEMWVVPRLARKRGMGNVKGTVEYRSPVCRARICRKSSLIFQHPSFILARRNNRHHFRGSSRVMPMPPGYTKVFGFAPRWCTIPSKSECTSFRRCVRICFLFIWILQRFSYIARFILYYIIAGF